MTDDENMSVLNSRYLDREGPTNVMAFPMREGPDAEMSPYLLGDVVISLDTAAREAKEARISLWRRFVELLIHGILHLFGHDHATADETALMEAEAARLAALMEGEADGQTCRKR